MAVWWAGRGTGLSGSRAEVQSTLHSEGKPTVNAFWGLNCDGHAFVPSQFCNLNPLGLSFFSPFLILPCEHGLPEESLAHVHVTYCSVGGVFQSWMRVTV